jgi:hypothetical protein
VCEGDGARPDRERGKKGTGRQVARRPYVADVAVGRFRRRLSPPQNGDNQRKTGGHEREGGQPSEPPHDVDQHC